MYSYLKIKQRPEYNLINSDKRRKFIDFINDHIKTLNHLKTHNNLNIEDPEKLIYSKLGDGERTVLIQGDSWAEVLETNKESRRIIIQNSKDNNLQFVLGGTSSYSPSLMSAQLNILRDNFNIEPEIVVAIIDQTDLGDELCRYRRLRYQENGKVFVKPAEKGTADYYNLYSGFAKYEILSMRLPATIRLIKYEMYNKKMYKNMERLKVRCDYDNILGILKKDLSRKDKKYWDVVFDEYLSNIFSKSTVKKLIIVTHPHFYHFTNEYKLNIYNLISQNVKHSVHIDKIELVNTDINEIYKKNRAKEVFTPNDRYSHLRKDYLTTYYLPKILNLLKISK